MGINEIAATVGKARETISRHICKSANYGLEMEWRKEQRSVRRKAYKKSWDQVNRRFDGESLKREHEQAVKILSAEKY